MIKISIIGYGNVAQHLINAFEQNSEVRIDQVFSRNPNAFLNSNSSFQIVSNFNELIPTDVFIIAVSDDSIAEVSAKLSVKNHLVVHTSGGVGLENLNNQNRRGVFYPLQTFTKNKKVDFKQIPICIETEFEYDLKILNKLAALISDKTYLINSQQRKALHVAAVFVNNFVNHLYQIGNEICQENQIPFSILEPLIKETASKIETLMPQNAQTGPAKRNDVKTIHSHLDFLKSNEIHQDIYKILTQSIQNNDKKL